MAGDNPTDKRNVGPQQGLHSLDNSKPLDLETSEPSGFLKIGGLYYE